MHDIEELAINTYNENMEFFKEKHEFLYNKLSALGLILEDGRYPQKYDLEYKDDHFNVIDIRTNEYLYPKSSNEYADDLTKEITLKKSDQVCETFFNYKFSPEAMVNAYEGDATTLHATTAPITHYYDEHVNSDMHFNKIDKFMFLGLGLSTHVDKILKKLNQPQILFLVEDDLELFRLSLFTCNYKNAIGNSVAYFCVGANEEEFNSTLNAFYNSSSILNQYLKFSLFSQNYQSKIKTIQEYVISRPEKCYSHERILNKNKLVLERLKDKYPFLDLLKKENETFFDDKPILVVGAGPSLREEIEWLNENKDKFVILSVFAALKTLSKYDISPDIVIQLDEKIPEAINLVNSFDNFDFVKNSVFIFSASAPDILFDTFNHHNIFVVEDRSFYKQEALQIVASSVGEVAYSISLLFNAKETYLLGLDLALSDDGSSHSKDHHWAKKLDVSKSDEIPTVTSLMQSTLKVKGNFRDEVYTTPLLVVSIPKLDRYTSVLKSDTQNVYNLCDGAYFKDVQPLHTKDVKNLCVINKANLHSGIHEVFSKYSSSTFTQSEIENINMRKNQIAILNTYVKNFEDAKTITKETFIDEYKRLLIAIMSSEKSELRELTVIYLFNTSNYVVDFFNTKELSNLKKHTKAMKKIVAIQLRKIFDYYEEIINKVEV